MTGRIRSWRPPAALLTLAVLVAACGSSGDGPGAAASADRAKTQIEDDLVDDVGLGPLVADCEPPTDAEPGTPFACSATTGDGEVVRFAAELVEPGTVAVRSTNLLSPRELERTAVEALRAQTDVDLADDALACPDDPVLVVEVGDTVECELANPRSRATDQAVVTVTAIGPVEFEVELG